MNDIPDLTEWVRAGTSTLQIMKAMIDLMPAGTDRNAAQEKMDEAAESLAFAETQLAKALGYHLCQCTFPPQIMLSIGRHPEYGEEIFKCRKCSKQEPSEHDFAEMKIVDEYNAGL